MAELNTTQIPAPRVGLIDPRTGFMAREWYRFLQELFTRAGLGQSEAGGFFAGLKEISSNYIPSNIDKHLICLADLTITLQTPEERSSELVVTNEGDNTISFVGLVNGDSGATIDFDQTSIRLRPITGGWKIV